MKNKKSYFYVLSCKDGTLYGGYTTDLERRLIEHNQGIGAKYTRPRSRRPVRMIYAEIFYSRSAATKAEAAFKKKARPVKNRYLKNNGVTFPLENHTGCTLVEMEESPSFSKDKEDLEIENTEKL